ncbi:MAG: hypothetical protein QHH74_11855 [Spirochaetota bacterium]|nr:hypothetical protein [Spirochaetota bacterium]
MERTKSSDVIRWKKIGGGHFIFNGRMIKPGQVFTASVDQISKNFRDLCVPLDELPPPPEEVPMDVVQAIYTVHPRGKSKTWFDVIDSRGKVINEKALKKEQAERFANDLTTAK